MPIEPRPTRARDTLRDVQKRRTRRRLLAAAKALFAYGGFMTCKVEDIAADAGVSRAAFYLHFKNKQAVLDALLVDEMKWHRRRYRGLKAEFAPTEEQLIAWIEGFVRGFAAARDAISLFYFAAAVGGRATTLEYAEREESVLTLGRQVPAFSVLNAAGEIDEQRHAELHLLLFELEQLAVQMGLGLWGHDPKIAIRTVARRLLAFAAEAPGCATMSEAPDGLRRRRPGA